MGPRMEGPGPSGVGWGGGGGGRGEALGKGVLRVPSIFMFYILIWDSDYRWSLGFAQGPQTQITRTLRAIVTEWLGMAS